MRSARGAVSVLPPVRFSEPPPQPGVPVSAHLAVGGDNELARAAFPLPVDVLYEEVELVVNVDHANFVHR